MFVQGPFSAAYRDVARYDRHVDIIKSDWAAANIWLESADCALARGAWLAICKDDRLVPISEVAIADDPGHALFLGLWSRLSDRRATLVDIARLNILLNTLGLVILAGFLLAVRATLTSIVLLVLGPVEYLGWMGTSPHWSFIGIVSMASVLPMALVAKEEGLLSHRAGQAFIAIGVIALAVAALVREPIGLMACAIGLAAIVVVALRRRQMKRPLPGLIAITASVVVAVAAPQWATMARDASFTMEPARHVQTHGLSHTLYIGLGFVENRLGIRYDDAFGEEVARRVDPDVVLGTTEYFRIMRKLYIDKVLEDPLEVARIYVEKAMLTLARPTLHPGPPFGVVLAIAAIHLLIATLLGAWRRLAFVQGLIIEVVALAFALAFLAQAALALPSHAYVVAVNGFVLVLFGVILEFFCRAIWRPISRRLAPVTTLSRLRS